MIIPTRGFTTLPEGGVGRSSVITAPYVMETLSILSPFMELALWLDAKSKNIAIEP
jgi:hypothetical protein